MNEGVDEVSLPPPERKMIDQRHFVEISYKRHDDGRIERLCRRGEITQKEKKVSRAALQRQQNFVKFGAVRVTVGPEKGITETRQEKFTVLWEGLSKQEQKKRAKEAAAALTGKQNSNMNNDIMDSKLQEMAINNQRIQSESSTMDNRKKRGGFVVPGKRNQGDPGYKPSYEEEEEKFEIRISNLPGYVLYMHI